MEKKIAKIGPVDPEIPLFSEAHRSKRSVVRNNVDTHVHVGGQETANAVSGCGCAGTEAG